MKYQSQNKQQASYRNSETKRQSSESEYEDKSWQTPEYGDKFENKKEALQNSEDKSFGNESPASQNKKAGSRSTTGNLTSSEPKEKNKRINNKTDGNQMKSQFKNENPVKNR